MSESTVQVDPQPAGLGEPDQSARSYPAGGLVTRFVAALIVSLATILAIVGLAVAIFFNPVWIGFAQERAGVPAITGYTPEQVRVATGSILADVLIGPPAFLVEVKGEPVLGDLERSHMADVHDVVRLFTIVVAIAVLALLMIAAANRRQAWVWRAVGRGSTALALAGVVIGIAVVFFFDAAFLLFHRIFFPQGNFLFDPRIQRLVQLFPEQLFVETAAALAVTGFLISIVVTLLARRAARRVTQ